MVDIFYIGFPISYMSPFYIEDYQTAVDDLCRLEGMELPMKLPLLRIV